jgi:urease accessory protein
MIQFAGHLRLRTRQQADGRTALAEQSFRAPFHLSKPYWDFETETLHVQVVNPTAGVLAGDRLESQICAGADTALLVTTPSATRVFTMRDGTAESVQHFAVEAGAWLEITPEPLVPHRGARYRQVTTLDVAAGGSVYYVDQLLPGRIAFGETWSWSDLCLDLRVRVAGALVLRERFTHSGAELKALAAFAGAGANACFANAVLIAPNPDPRPSWCAALHALQRGGTRIGVSALAAGGWSLRMTAPDPLQLRDTLRAVRSVLSAHFPRLRCDLRRVG